MESVGHAYSGEQQPILSLVGHDTMLSYLVVHDLNDPYNHHRGFKMLAQSQTHQITLDSTTLQKGKRPNLAQSKVSFEDFVRYARLVLIEFEVIQVVKLCPPVIHCEKVLHENVKTL